MLEPAAFRSPERPPVASGHAAGRLETGDDLPPLSVGALLAETDAKLEQGGEGGFAPPLRAGGESTAAPYLYVPARGDGGERLPLKSTSARVTVSGVIAQVEVTQVYQNRGDQPIEAMYVFPASTRAAVHGMRMTIGRRVVAAKIEKRVKAREDYEAAKQRGKRASLLEQERSNVFRMSVANIMPGDVIKTELLCSELIVPEDGIYTFVYPTVIGPRNATGIDPATHDWIGNPHLRAGEPPPYGFDLRIQLQSPIPFKAVSSPSHPVKVTYPSPRSANIELVQQGGGDRDFILQYKLRGDEIQSGTLVYDDGGEKFFLTMVEPPARVKPPRC